MCDLTCVARRCVDRSTRTICVSPAGTIVNADAMLSSASDWAGWLTSVRVSNSIHSVSPRRNTADGVSRSNGKRTRTVPEASSITGVIASPGT